MVCAICGVEIARGKRFQSPTYKTTHFCSEDCYNRFCALKKSPKEVVNYKPKTGTDRRKFTDFLQMWFPYEPNWALLMKQAKDIQEEYEIDWHEMYLVLKYCKDYEQIELIPEYGLYQFFPKYIQPMRLFKDKCSQSRKEAENWDCSQIRYIIKKSNHRNKLDESW